MDHPLRPSAAPSWGASLTRNGPCGPVLDCERQPRPCGWHRERTGAAGSAAAARSGKVARVQSRAAWWLLLLLLLSSGACARVLQVHSIVMTVADLERSAAFYESVLGLRRTAVAVVSGPEIDQLTGVFGARVRRATLQLGAETIELEQYLSPAGQPLPADSRANDLWFQHFAIVVRDMDAAFAQVSRHAVRSISTAPQTIPESNAAAAGIRAYKFMDPDGHPLELLYFPPGKGDAKWQRAGDALFLGIDHSAITVSSTERAQAFWAGLLGLAVAGGSLNSGPTQEHLDGTEGAVVRITGLSAPRGPGVEFLQYLAPSGGRAAPATLRPNDIAATRMVVEVDDLDRLAEHFTKQGVAFVSSQPVALPGSAFTRALIVKDPDGHALQLVQRR
jgi:catechol 2,3-dioxygenase-like lactoylglutathione lyase family enzyme